jgi:hypothetical protein
MKNESGPDDVITRIRPFDVVRCSPVAKASKDYFQFPAQDF